MFWRNKIANKDARGKALPFTMHTQSDMERYRADTFYTKEPETLVWLDGMPSEGIFIDVGANIGVYSLYCAMTKPYAQVYAFEPMLENFARLVDNIKLNDARNITPFNMAMGRQWELTGFYPESCETGASGGQIGAPINENGNVYAPAAKREILTIPLDGFASMLPPNRAIYLKIDVDGHEMDIIRGIYNYGHAIRSLLVEINTRQVSVIAVTEAMRALGLSPDNRINHMKPHSSERRGGNPVNMVFTRKKNLDK